MTPLAKAKRDWAETLSAQEKRWLHLKRELARGFRNGTCLLVDIDWLHKNDVTLAECGRLSDWIADALDTRILR